MGRNAILLGTTTIYLALLRIGGWIAVLPCPERSRGSWGNQLQSKRTINPSQGMIEVGGDHILLALLYPTEPTRVSCRCLGELDR